jgi:hypothetical protein
MESAKIIFLDFDDVLNTSKTLERGELFETAKIGLLNDILERTDAKIVVTSNWRLAATPEELEEIMVEAGVLAAGRVTGVTPWIEDLSRGAEIKAWLKNAPVPVSEFVILDDRTDMETFAQRLVQTDPRFGLVPGQVEDVIGLLGEASTAAGVP